MLPTVGADSPKIVRYAAEVAGRILGVAAMKNLVPNADRRAALENAANAILASTQGLKSAYVTRIVFETFDHRIAFGKARGIDRGFDAIVGTTSETIRTSLTDRGPQNPDYRAIFPNGTEEYTSPTIREDEQIATDLRALVHDSNVPVKADILALLDSVIPIVGPAATALKDGEKQINALFQTELNARKSVVDALWEQRKIVETALGRGGRVLARFIFFDFRKSSDSDALDAPEAENAPKPADG